MTSYKLEKQVGYILRLVSQRHAGIFNSGAVMGLTATQFAALMRVHEHGSCSQNQLGRLSAMDGATIKGVVDRLRKKGMVHIASDPNDKRRSLISLTDQAKEILPELQAAGHQITEKTLAPLSAAEQHTLLTILQKII